MFAFKPNLSKEILGCDFSPDAETECWCPCKCGCKGSELLPYGLCQDCVDGIHEVPPNSALPSLSDLIALHQSIIDLYNQVLKTEKLAPSLDELEAAHRTEKQYECPHCHKPGGH